jgi:ATP-dependent helicase YprA (DUF1998 family)
MRPTAPIHALSRPRYGRRIVQRSIPVDDLKTTIDLDLNNFSELFVARVKHPLRPFQLEAITAQLKHQDVVVHAGTGSGKTTIVAGPHIHPGCRGRVTILISPLIALHEEQVSCSGRT